MCCSLMGGILFSIIRNLPNGKVAEDVAKVVADALLPYANNFRETRPSHFGPTRNCWNYSTS